MNNSRSANAAKNTFFAAFAFLIKTILSFLVRAIFIKYIAAEYLGLNGLFTNILNVLSLAELGIGNAIVYSMYKPIADNDIPKINSFVALYKKFYLIIGIAITIVGLSLIPALPKLIKDSPDIQVNLSVVYVLYLAQTVVGYFFAYRRSLIFAYQRNDIESKVNFLTTVLMSLSQIIILIFWQNYYAYIVAMVVFLTLDSLMVFLISFKMFPNIRGKALPLERIEKQTIIKNTGALAFHKLGYVAVFSTDSIIISIFLGSAVLGIYSNYTMVTSALLSVITIFVTSVRSSVGNMISTNTKEDVYKVYKALNFVHMWIVGFSTIGLICCFQDFIKILANSDSYKLPLFTVILICISFFLTSSRRMTDAFKECAGLFWNDKFKPLIESATNIILDLILVNIWGINGVLIATIVSTLIAPLWVEPYVLYKHYFKEKVRSYFVKYIVEAIIFVIIGVITFFLCWLIPISGWIGFLIKIVICIIFPNIVLISIYFRTSEFKYLFNIITKFFKKTQKN